MSERPEIFSTTADVPCSYHPSVMTRLRCSRCGKPICPRCGVRTPVGLRCPDCAGVRGLPNYRTDSSVLIRAIGAGLAVAIVVSVLWWLIPSWNFYLTLLTAFGVTEIVSYVAKHKRGVDLQAAAIGLVILSLALGRAWLAVKLGYSWEEINAFPEWVQAQLHLNPRPNIVFLALAVIIPWYRFR